MTLARPGPSDGPAATLHITFDAGADVLRAALAGRDEPVLMLDDDLAAGPIAGERRGGEAFWTEALAAGARRIVWTDRRVARQYAGLMAFVARAGDAEFEIIDLTHAGVPPLWTLEPERVGALLDKTASLSPEARRDLAADWEALEAENAPFRIIEAGRLISAPEVVFDAAILAQCSRYWMRAPLVMDMVLSAERGRGVMNLSPSTMERRIAALVASGRLEAGESPVPAQGFELRLPQLDDRQPC